MAILPLVACGGRVIVDAEESSEPTTTSTAVSGGGEGGAEAFCGRVCEEMMAKAPYCGHVDVCTNDCVDQWTGTEAKGCVDELIVVWECMLAGVKAGKMCPVICEEEQGAWFDCKNQ